MLPPIPAASPFENLEPLCHATVHAIPVDQPKSRSAFFCSSVSAEKRPDTRSTADIFRDAINDEILNIASWIPTRLSIKKVASGSVR